MLKGDPEQLVEPEAMPETPSKCRHNIYSVGRRYVETNLWRENPLTVCGSVAEMGMSSERKWGSSVCNGSAEI
jgi:hypothetical protein